MTAIHREYLACKGGSLQPTPSDISGPFYKPGAPMKRMLVGFPALIVSGRVLDTDGQVILGALLDVWQADEEGNYDNEGFHLRGQQVAEDGTYSIQTIHPGDYKIDDNEFRCAHIHVKLTAEGYQPLTTQLYFSDDPYNETDHWFDARRVIGSVNDAQVQFDFVLAKV